jgi:hypothetical protein
MSGLQRHLEQSTFLDEILDDDEDIGYCSDEESSKADNYMQLVLLGTQEISNIDDGDDIAICDNQQMGMRRVSRILSWQDIGKFSAAQEIFHGTCGPQFSTTDVDIEVLQKCFDTVLMQHTVKETKKYAHQKITKSVIPFIFCARTTK